VIEKALTDESGLADDPFVAEYRLNVALYDRDLDAAERLAAALPLKRWSGAEAAVVNQDGRDFWLGVVANLKGDAATARAAFMRARTELEEEIRVHPDNVRLLSNLGLIDAALDRKEEALSESRRAVDLLPITEDAVEGFELLTNLALTYTWVGEKDLAIKQLEELSRYPVWSLLADCVCTRSGIPCAAIRASKKWSPPLRPRRHPPIGDRSGCALFSYPKYRLDMYSEDLGAGEGSWQRRASNFSLSWITLAKVEIIARVFSTTAIYAVALDTSDRVSLCPGCGPRAGRERGDGACGCHRFVPSIPVAEAEGRCRSRILRASS